MADNTSNREASTTATRGTYPEGRDPLKEIRQLDARRFKVESAVFGMGETLKTISSLAGVVVLAESQPDVKTAIEKLNDDYQVFYLESVNYSLALQLYFARNGPGRSGLLHPRDRQDIEDNFRNFKLAVSKLRRRLLGVESLCHGLFGSNDHEQPLNEDLSVNPYQPVVAELLDDKPEWSIDDRVWRVAKTFGVRIEKN